MTTSVGRNPKEFTERGIYLLYSLIHEKCYVSSLRQVTTGPLIILQGCTWRITIRCRWVFRLVVIRHQVHKRHSTSSTLTISTRLIFLSLTSQGDNFFVSAISSQLKRHSKLNPENTRRLVDFWTASIFRYEGWSQVSIVIVPDWLLRTLVAYQLLTFWSSLAICWISHRSSEKHSKAIFERSKRRLEPKFVNQLFRTHRCRRTDGRSAVYSIA